MRAIAYDIERVTPHSRSVEGEKQACMPR